VRSCDDYLHLRCPADRRNHVRLRRGEPDLVVDPIDWVGQPVDPAIAAGIGLDAMCNVTPDQQHHRDRYRCRI